MKLQQAKGSKDGVLCVLCNGTGWNASNSTTMPSKCFSCGGKGIIKTKRGKRGRSSYSCDPVHPVKEFR